VRSSGRSSSPWVAARVAVVLEPGEIERALVVTVGCA